MKFLVSQKTITKYIVVLELKGSILDFDQSLIFFSFNRIFRYSLIYMKNESRLEKSMALFVAPILIVLVVDILSKYYVNAIIGEMLLPFIKIKIVHNHGIVMGFLSNYPNVIKVTILTSIGFMIIFLYILGIWLLPICSKKIFIGLSVLTGGALGNLVDRFQNGSVTDFISLNFWSLSTPYFNLADLFQWIAYFLIIAGLVDDFRYYWPKNDWRKRYFLNKKFQGRLSSFVGFITVSSGLIVLVFSYGFLYLLGDIKVLQTYLIFGLFIIVFISIMTTLLTLMMSHRIVGPVYAMIRHLNDVLNDQEVVFKLRNNDEFRDFESELNNLSEKIRNLQLKKNDD